MVITGEEAMTNGIRKGQLDWVCPIEKASEFKSWAFKFGMGAKVYLSALLYPNDEERHFAFMIALLKAASQGKFAEMEQYLELLNATGVRAEALLPALEKKFLPSKEIERKRATLKYLGYTRERKPLHEALKDLNVLYLECIKYGYDPGHPTHIARIESLIYTADMPIFRLYLNKESSVEGSELEKTLRAAEALAKDQENTSVSATHSQGGPQFAGATQDRSKRNEGHRREFRKNHRKGHPADKQATASSKKTCTKCGNGNCPTLLKNSEGKPCFASGKKCNVCGKEGHYGKVCRKKGKNLASVAEAHEDESSSDDQSGSF